MGELSDVDLAMQSAPTETEQQAEVAEGGGETADTGPPEDGNPPAEPEATQPSG
jgi:hypothetical protein